MTCKDIDVQFLKRAWKSKEKTLGLCKVGALVVNLENEVVGEGLSKWPLGDHWIDDEDYQEFVDQAEIDAIKGRDFRGFTLYTTHCPNEDSARCIIQTGIKRVVYIENNPLYRSGLRLLIAAEVEVVQMKLSDCLRPIRASSSPSAEKDRNRDENKETWEQITECPMYYRKGAAVERGAASRTPSRRVKSPNEDNVEEIEVAEGGS